MIHRDLDPGSAAAFHPRFSIMHASAPPLAGAKVRMFAMTPSLRKWELYVTAALRWEENVAFFVEQRVN